MRKNIYLKSTLVLIVFIINSCALKPTQATTKYVKLNNVEISDLGNGRILFHNSGYYCPVATCGWATKMNIIANNVNLGQINYGEYFIVDLPLGDYEIQTIYKDVLKFKPKHKVRIDANTKVISVSVNSFSKKLKVTNILPYDVNNLLQLSN
jgi:hypothetical protein